MKDLNAYDIEEAKNNCRFCKIYGNTSERLKWNLEKKSKRYRELTKDLDQTKSYKINEAIKLIKKSSKVKFIESVDLSINLNLGKDKADQTLRTTVDLPHGNGKKRVAVICSNEKIEEAKSSNAEKFGSEDLVDEINNGKVDFDILVCTPDMMSKVGKLGKFWVQKV